MGLVNWLLRRNKPTQNSPHTSDGRRVDATPRPLAYAVVDVETTGLSPQRDRILELAIIRLDDAGVIVDEWVARFDPEGPVGATHIHGITDADVAGQPRFADLAPAVVQALSGLAVVAHNAKFDLAFLRNELKAAGWEVPWIASYCTFDASYAYLPDMDRRRLTDCCWAVGVPVEDAHSALGDARATAGLLNAYIARNGGPDPVLLEARATAQTTTWPASPSRAPSAVTRRSEAPRRQRPARITPARPAVPALVQQLTAMSLLEVVEEGAPVGTTAYLEMLLEALEDGDISDTEAAALRDLCAEFALTTTDVLIAHEAFLLTLAHRAVDDGRVSHDERRELKRIASLLSVPESKLKQVIDQADAARKNRLSAALGALPDPWPHGEPLRVGDRVVFTGCDETQRRRLEARSEELGVRVIGAVSKLTAMLVTDGSFSGGKLGKASELGTRQVHPDTFEVLLRHLQPARTEAVAAPARVQPPTVVNIDTTGPSSPAPSPSVVRAWALSAGHSVGVRGRLPQSVYDAYVAAHPSSVTSTTA